MNSDAADRGDSVIWDGHNVEEVSAFAERHGFGFAVGSPVHNYRWWHSSLSRLFALLGREWSTREDPYVLEVYQRDTLMWTTARPGDMLLPSGDVLKVAPDRRPWWYD